MRTHLEEAKQQLKLFRPAFIKNWRKLLKNPMYTLGMFFMKTCEFAVVWLGYLKNIDVGLISRETKKINIYINEDRPSRYPYMNERESTIEIVEH